MAEVIPYPKVHRCERCWGDIPEEYAVLDGTKVLGPYCQGCAIQKAGELNKYQRAVDEVVSREGALQENEDA